MIVIIIIMYTYVGIPYSVDIPFSVIIPSDDSVDIPFSVLTFMINLTVNS